MKKLKKLSKYFPAPLLFVLALLIAWTVFAVVWKLATRVPVRQLAEARVAQTPMVTSTPVLWRRLLDGVAVSDPVFVAEPVVAVMVDWHRDAHPVSGIDRASLVYEVPVEGGISRLLAVFGAGTVVGEVGPVRSARPYFIDIAAEYGALYLHVGGSPEATKQLRKRKDVANLDQWYHSRFYWLDRRRASPHHVYTSSTRWRAAMTERRVSTSTFGSWYFSDDVPVGLAPATEIRVPSVHNGAVIWRWNGERYVRQFGADAYRTRAGDAIAMNTIVVQQVTQRVLDAEGRLDLGTESEGFAWVFRDGVMSRGFWNYNKKEHRTRWYDDQGGEIPLRSGKLWVQVVPIGVEPIVS